VRSATYLDYRLPTWIIDYLKIFLGAIANVVRKGFPGGFKKIYIANYVRKGLDYRLPTWIMD